MRRLVAACGFARSGKDALCAALGFQRVAFADALKSDLAPIFAKLPPHNKEMIRPLLVEYGRTARRLDPDYWVKRLVLPESGDVFGSDCRYKNEVQFFLDHGGIVFRIHRSGVVAANDEEARSIAEIDATFHLPVIVNDSSIEEAASRVREVLDGAHTPYPAVEVARQRASRKYEGQLELH